MNFSLEAVKTNVIGTDNVLSFGENKVKKIICLSTDKAVYPNAMSVKSNDGKVFVAKSRTTGNHVELDMGMLASRGSVIPHFMIK